MQSLDVNDPGLPDLQFVLMVAALCTSGLRTLNVPEELRQTIFDRCWVLLHETPPPADPQQRVLDLRYGTELTLDAMVQTIRHLLNEAGISMLTWDHPVSEPSRPSTPAAAPLIERLGRLYPHPTEPSPADPSAGQA